MSRRAGIAGLIAPRSIDRFFQAYWGRRVLIVERNDSNFYDDLPSVADYDFLLASLAAPEDGWFSLVKGRAQRPPKSALTSEGTLDLAEVYGAVGQGHSLLLTKLHRRHAGIGRLCRELEAEFTQRGVLLSQPIAANGYFTPRSAQGFAAHYDAHDVFILQLAGHKHWRIYRRTVEAPVEPPVQSLTPEETGKPAHELVLSPGDVVYIPRGVAHEACTTEDLSLHLTLSVHPATWRDVFSGILTASAPFRRNLPRGFASHGRLRARDRRLLRDLARRLPDDPKTAVAVAQVGGRLLSESDLPPHSGLHDIAAAAPLTTASRLKLSDGVRSTVEVSGPSVILYLPGTSIRGDRALEPAFRHIARGLEFCVRDLPVAADDASKLKLVDDLLRYGYLTRCAKPRRSP